MSTHAHRIAVRPDLPLPAPQADAPSIPVLHAPPDTLRAPAQSLKQAALAPHPVAEIEATVRSWEGAREQDRRLHTRLAACVRL